MPEKANFTLVEEKQEAVGELEEEKDKVAEIDEAEKALQPAEQQTIPQTQSKLDALRVIEAALFLGNRTFTYAELAIIAKVQVRKAKEIVETLAREYAGRENAVEVAFDAANATMQVKPEFLASVAALSKQVELSRKASRMLALVAKKGKILQSELRKYFRGDIYGYMTELKELGYITSEKSGNTRLIKPTTKFYENFQMAKT